MWASLLQYCMTRAVDSSGNDEGGGDPVKWVIEGHHLHPAKGHFLELQIRTV